jgi:hypothetical protein
MPLRLPVQGVVDRSVLLHMYLISTPVIDSTGKTVEILKDPVGGPYGALPADPAWFGEGAGYRFAVCLLRSRRAAV